MKPANKRLRAIVIVGCIQVVFVVIKLHLRKILVPGFNDLKIILLINPEGDKLLFCFDLRRQVSCDLVT